MLSYYLKLTIKSSILDYTLLPNDLNPSSGPNQSQKSFFEKQLIYFFNFFKHDEAGEKAISLRQ